MVYYSRLRLSDGNYSRLRLPDGNYSRSKLLFDNYSRLRLPYDNYSRTRNDIQKYTVKKWNTWMHKTKRKYTKLYVNAWNNTKMHKMIRKCMNLKLQVNAYKKIYSNQLRPNYVKVWSSLYYNNCFCFIFAFVNRYPYREIKLSIGIFMYLLCVEN